MATLLSYATPIATRSLEAVHELKASRTDFEWIVILFTTILLLDVVNFLGCSNSARGPTEAHEAIRFRLSQVV